jgi:putative phosphoesterase
MERSDHRSGRLIGIISDTHGYLDPVALKTFADADRIIHAGDIGKAEVIENLKKIAPVTVVRGNMDRESWCAKLPAEAVVEADGVSIYILHDLQRINLDPQDAGVKVVISGHSHRPEIIEKKGVLYVNPGSASLPRHHRMPTVALMKTRHGKVDIRIVELQ